MNPRLIERLKLVVTETLALLGFVGTIAAVSLLLVFCSPVEAADDRGRALPVAATALLIADWSQTRDIARRADIKEMNPILGPDPAMGEVNRYFMTSIALTWAAWYYLPEPWNDRVMVGVIVIQSGTVARNASIGVRFRF